MIRNGDPWFVAKDVAEVLGYSDTDAAVRAHCKALKMFKAGDLPGLPSRGLTIIPERDVYRLVMRSKLPSAERFENWVVGDVLPAIRKTGGYVMGQEKLATGEMGREEFIARAFLMTHEALLPRLASPSYLAGHLFRNRWVRRGQRQDEAADGEEDL